MARVWLGVLLYAAVCPIAYSAASDFGTTGLIKMPNARMEKDGALRATVSLDKVANIYNVSFQALPRVKRLAGIPFLTRERFAAPQTVCAIEATKLRRWLLRSLV